MLALSCWQRAWSIIVLLLKVEPADCPSEVIRFCPICDGYEAIDRRVGVLGDIEAGGKKALFLRTYTKDVSLFLTDETTVDVDWQEKAHKSNVRIVGDLQQIRQATENTVTIATRQAAKPRKSMLSTLLLAAPFVPTLPLRSEPHRRRMAILLLMTISGRPLKPSMRQGTS